MFRGLMFGIALATALLGCATQPVSLKPDAQSALQSIDSVLLMPKSKIDVSVTTRYHGAGLIPALLGEYADAKRVESATVEAAPILKELEAYDFTAVFRESWVEQLSMIASPRFLMPPVVDTTALNDANLGINKKANYDRSEATAVLFAKIDHTLQSGTLMITAYVEIYPKSPPLMKFRERPVDGDPMNDGNVIYRNAYTYKKEFVTLNTIKRGLDQGAVDIARQVAADIGRRHQ